MSMLDKVTEKAIGNYGRVAGAETAFDPATIVVFLELITGLIQLFKDCKQKPTDALKIAQKPGPLQKIVLRRNVKKMLDREDRRLGNSFNKALLDTGENLTLEEIQGLYDEVD